LKFAGSIPTLLIIIFAVAPLCSAGPIPIDESTYYVSPEGDDSGTGTKENPWRSPGKACRRINHGDTLVLLPGRYQLRSFETDILRPPSGRRGKWTIIRGTGGKYRPVLAGGGNLAYAIDLAGTRYVRIENLEISSDDGAAGAERFFRDGVSAIGAPAADIDLSDLYIHHLDEFGINFQDVDRLEISGCRIDFCGFGAVGGPEGEAGGWRHVDIDNCRFAYSGFYYQGGDGSNRPYDRPDGIGLERSVGPVAIVHTTADHNRGDGIDLKTGHSTVSDCVVANNACDGVKLWGDGSRIENTLIYGTGDGIGGPSHWAGIVIGTTDPGSAFEITNVTLHDNPSRIAYPIYVQYDDRDVPISVEMRNCIIAGGYGTAFFGPSVSLTAEHNLFYRPGAEIQIEANGKAYRRRELETLGSGNIHGDPRFIRPAWGEPGDYQLLKGSPAIDRASTTDTPDRDIDSTARPARSGFDIGAYEWTREGRKLKRPRALTAAISGRSVTLRWKDRSSNETGFVIERKTSEDSHWIWLDTVRANEESFSDRVSRRGNDYFYRVRAVTGSRSSAYSNIVKVVY